MPLPPDIITPGIPYPTEGDDTVYLGPGEDTLHALGGNDFVHGGANSDRIWGDAGDDTLYGGGSADKLRGGEGDDVLNGGGGADRLYGDAGDDIIIGANGDDVLFGDNPNDPWSTGSDLFIFDEHDGRDQVFDFEVGSDHVGLTGGSDYTLTFNGKNSFLKYGETTVVFYNAHLTDGDILFT